MDRSVFTGYREMGFTPIPLQPRGKRPRLETWKEYQSRQPTDAEIDAWLAAGDCNVGLVMGRGLFALDCDGDWGACLMLLAEYGIFLPEDAPRQKTGKGNHVLLTAPFQVNDFVGLFKAPGVAIDVRGVGYIAAAPSIHPNGHSYEWVVAPTTTPPAAPEALLVRLRKDTHIGSERTQSGIIASEPERPAWVSELLLNGAPEGGRNAAGAKLAGYLYATMPPDVAEATMVMWAERCTPPLPRSEVLTICRSIGHREAMKPKEVQQSVEFSDLQSVGDIAYGMMHAIDQPTKFLKTGFDDLDALLGGGMLFEEYMIIGARPSIGKSAMAHQISRYNARNGVRVLVISLEMGKRAVVGRMVAAESGLEATRIRQGGLRGDELARFIKAADALSDLPIYVETRLSEAEAVVELVVKRGPFGLVVVDFAQKMHARRRGDDRRLEIDAISAVLDREISKGMNIPVILLSSMSRPTKDKDERPSLTGLKESGGLESDADIVVLLSRKSLKDPLVDVEVAKARNARVGSFQLRYDGAHYTFTSIRPQPRARAEDAELPF